MASEQVLTVSFARTRTHTPMFRVIYPSTCLYTLIPEHPGVWDSNELRSCSSHISQLVCYRW